MAAAVAESAGNVTVSPTAFSNSSLYVGDLDNGVNEGQLYELFNQVAQVVSLRVCRDYRRRSSLGYAYVNYSSHQDAANAKEILNFITLNGKPIRIMFSHRDPSIRKSGHANVFVKNLDLSIDNKALHDIFIPFGTILSCKVALDSNGQSKGYGFVQFDTEESAKTAIENLNGMLINDKQVYVGSFVRRQQRVQANTVPMFTNIYVKNFPETTTDEDLKKIFGAYGTITSAIVMKDANGKSKCFGFVNFQSPNSAAAAVEKLNGTMLNDKSLYVGRAQKKAEREAELKEKIKQKRLGKYEKLQGANLYLKNLDDSINDEKLKELFSEFGTVTSCKVMLGAQGVSKGSGFVAFSTPEEAAKAMHEMNGRMVGQKPIYVAVAQRKEERKAQLQQHFAQLQSTGSMTLFPGVISGFLPGAPRLGPHQLYFGQGAPGLVPSQAVGYGFQQQMRPGVASNFIIPYQLQRHGQPVQHMGIRRGGNRRGQQQHQATHPDPHQGFRYVARNSINPSVVAHGGLMGAAVMPESFDMSGMPMAPIDIQQSGPVPISKLASALASATPEDQRALLGEQLFPLVHHLDNKHAAKVTGMF